MEKATFAANDNPYAGRIGLVYVRVSDKKQEVKGHGRESQEKRCKDELDFLGVPYAESFLDTFTGGGNFMHRPAMRDLLAYIDAHPKQKFVVVFDDLKRFARDLQFHLELRTAYKKRDVVLRCLNYNFDESPTGRFVEGVLAGAAQLEREQNADQVKNKTKTHLENGYWPFPRKSGYTFDTDALERRVGVPTQKAVDVLAPALEDFASGKLLRKIDFAARLVENEYWPKRPPVRYLDRALKLLTDPFYCGDIEFPSWDVSRRDGHHVPIISRPTFERIQKRLKKAGTRTWSRQEFSDEFPLRGLLICSACDGHLTGAPSKGRSKQYSYYYCQNKRCSLYSKMFRKADVESRFRELLERNALKADADKVIVIVFDRVWRQEIVEVEQLKRQAVQEKAALKEEVRQLTSLVRKASEQGSVVLQQTYESQIEEVAGRLGKVEELLATEFDSEAAYRTALGKALGMVKSPLMIWDSVDVYEKHRLFFFLFESKLVYAKDDGYRTADSLSTTRLFEELADQNSLNVRRVGFEPT